MILLGNLLIGVGNILGGLLSLYFWIVFIAVLLSWVSPDPRNQIVQILRQITEPSFRYVRRYVKPIGMFDLSPIVVLIGIQLLQYVLVASLIAYGHKFVASGGTTVIGG
jgi:YggT family protein